MVGEAVISRLHELGFATAAVVSDRLPNALFCIRAKTSRGWSYQKFTEDTAEAADAWARNRSPAQ